MFVGEAHEWDENSHMICNECDHSDIALEFDLAGRQPSPDVGPIA